MDDDCECGEGVMSGGGGGGVEGEEACESGVGEGEVEGVERERGVRVRRVRMRRESGVTLAWLWWIPFSIYRCRDMGLRML